MFNITKVLMIIAAVFAMPGLVSAISFSTVNVYDGTLITMIFDDGGVAYYDTVNSMFAGYQSGTGQVPTDGELAQLEEMLVTYYLVHHPASPPAEPPVEPPVVELPVEPPVVEPPVVEPVIQPVVPKDTVVRIEGTDTYFANGFETHVIHPSKARSVANTVGMPDNSSFNITAEAAEHLGKPKTIYSSDAL